MSYSPPENIIQKPLTNKENLQRQIIQTPSKERRMQGIKQKFIPYPEIGECSKCKKKYTKTFLFSVTRWSSGMTTKEYLYCKECFNNKEDILTEIDNDNILYGIAHIDDFFSFEKVNPENSNEYTNTILNKFKKGD